MTTSFEWDIEDYTLDEFEDIVAHRHQDKLENYFPQDLLDALNNTKTGEGEASRLVLVRDGSDGSRAWAYVTNKSLPVYFRDAFDNITHKVPIQYHRELAKAIKTL